MKEETLSYTINYLDEVELYATRVINEEFSERVVFHDIAHAHKVISAVKRIGKTEGLTAEKIETILIAAWFSRIGFKNFKNTRTCKSPLEYIQQCCQSAIDESKSFLTSINYPNEKIKTVLSLLKNLSPDQPPNTLEDQVLADALTIEWSSKKARKRILLQYQEFELQDVIKDDKESYFENIVERLKDHRYYTKYGQEVLAPKKAVLINKLEEELVGLTTDVYKSLSKELGISKAELKKLKKNLKKNQGRDDRGIQTMFRTTSRNHYTLNQMVDRKASILISVNAIILSLIISQVLVNFETICVHSLPVLALLLSSLISVIFAVLSILPSSTHGEFTEEQIRAKQGNLLYFGNFHNMSLNDYNWGMLRMLNDGNYLYSSMIRDLYFFGQRLQVKYQKIRMALVVFILGIIIAVLIFFVLTLFPNFHIGGQHISG